MVRIVGVNIPDQKRIIIALTYIFGIGLSKAGEILEKARIDPNRKTLELSESERERIHEIINRDYKIEGAKRQEISQNIKRLKEISSYRGIRHIKNLPVRGQRTRTNARTKRGKRVTVGSGRKKPAEKT